MFKGAIFGIFEHPKTFFWQNVLLFFCPIHEKCFFNHFLILNKTHMLSTTVFKNFKLFKYWIEEKKFGCQKNSFLEPNLIQKDTKNQDYHPIFF